MRAGRETGPDWRDAAAYAPLLGADRSLFAWEWLRRDPQYVAAAARALSNSRSKTACDAASFGLVAFEDPALAVPAARPLWSSRVHPFVLQVARRGGAGAENAFDLGRWGSIAVLVRQGRREHLLLCDGLRAVRLEGPMGTFEPGAILSYRLAGIAAAERPLLTLRRFLALCREGRFMAGLHRPEPRARRWIMALRAWDALAAGADQRDIAQLLFSATAGEPQWRSREPSVRSRAQRLVRAAREAAAGGYRALLR